jgi:hypothetical protein
LDPVTRVKFNGSMTFYEAKGNIFTSNGKQYMSVLVHSTVQYQVTIWSWDKQDQQWIQVFDGPFSYSDTYSNGPMQFSITDAELSGSSLVATMPDVEGNFTYGYILTLVPNL